MIVGADDRLPRGGDVAEHTALVGTQPGGSGTSDDVAHLVRSPVPFGLHVALAAAAHGFRRWDTACVELRGQPIQSLSGEDAAGQLAHERRGGGVGYLPEQGAGVRVVLTLVAVGDAAVGPTGNISDSCTSTRSAWDPWVAESARRAGRAPRPPGSVTRVPST